MKRLAWFVLGVMLMSQPASTVALSVNLFYDTTTETYYNYVLFAAGSARLSETAKRILDRQAAMLISAGRLKVSIEGFVDKGEADSKRAAIELGKRRAQAVKDYLVSKGITADLIRADGYGFHDFHRGPAMNRVAVTKLR